MAPDSGTKIKRGKVANWCETCKHQPTNSAHSFCHHGRELLCSGTPDDHKKWEPIKTESDPNGIDQHAPGAKLDQGKLMAGIIQQWPRALTAALEVATFGANKYTRGGWQHVENGVERYTDAMFRHLLKEPMEDVDPDSGLAHDAHVAWNALSRLELRLRGAE